MPESTDKPVPLVNAPPARRGDFALQREDGSAVSAEDYKTDNAREGAKPPANKPAATRTAPDLKTPEGMLEGQKHLQSYLSPGITAALLSNPAYHFDQRIDQMRGLIAASYKPDLNAADVAASPEPIRPAMGQLLAARQQEQGMARVIDQLPAGLVRLQVADMGASHATAMARVAAPAIGGPGPQQGGGRLA